MAQASPANQCEGATRTHSRAQLGITRCLGGDRGLLDQFKTALSLAFEIELSRYYTEYVSRDPEKVGGIAVLEFKFNL